MKEKRYTVIIDQDKDGITWRQIKTSEGFKTTYHQDNYEYYLMRINLLDARGYTKEKTITKSLRHEPI